MLKRLLKKLEDDSKFLEKFLINFGLKKYTNTKYVVLSLYMQFLYKRECISRT